LSLAKITKSQHKTALAKLSTLAKSLHVTLPTSPNATQLKQANQLKKLSGMSFNKTYDQDQIAGHVLSISQTNTEISKGRDAKVVDFANYYLPIAQMHLKMALKLKTELAHGATPHRKGRLRGRTPPASRSRSPRHSRQAGAVQPSAAPGTSHQHHASALAACAHG
jgi:hypothetical protein